MTSKFPSHFFESSSIFNLLKQTVHEFWKIFTFHPKAPIANPLSGPSWAASLRETPSKKSRLSRPGSWEKANLLTAPATNQQLFSCLIKPKTSGATHKLLSCPQPSSHFLRLPAWCPTMQWTSKMLVSSEYWGDVLESCRNPLSAKDHIVVYRNANADQWSICTSYT